MISTLIARTPHHVLTHKRPPQATVCTIRCNSLTTPGTVDILFYSPGYLVIVLQSDFMSSRMVDDGKKVDGRS